MRKIVILLAAIALAGLPAFPAVAAETAPIVQPKAATPETKPPGETVPASPATPAQPVRVPPTRPAQAVKIGFVDMSRVAGESVPGKAAAGNVKARSGKFRSQIETRQKQLEKQKADIEAQMQTLTPEQRTAKAKEFQKKLGDFQKFVEKAQKDLQTREAELLGKLYKAIEKSAGDYGQANGFAAVVAKKELLYLGDNVEVKDVTDEIIKMVNEGQGKK